MTNEPLARTDEELVEDYLAGDVGALRAIIDRYHDPLFRFLFRLMGDRQSAEDVFQETFLQIHQSLDTFDPTRRFKPWLFTIAANKGRDALRKRNRRAAVSLSARTRDGLGGGGCALVDLLEVEIPGVESGLEAEEQSRMVQNAIETLSPRLREALLMAYFQKLSYQQLADALGVPLGTVKSRLHAAVAAFARAWQEQVKQARERESDSKSRRELAN